MLRWLTQPTDKAVRQACVRADRRDARPAVMEPMEGRRLMSASAFDDSFAVSASTDTSAQASRPRCVNNLKQLVLAAPLAG